MGIQLGSLSLGWREILLAVVVMLGMYMLFVAWMMRRVRRLAQPKPPLPQEPTVQAAAGVAAYAATAAVGQVEPEAPMVDSIESPSLPRVPSTIEPPSDMGLDASAVASLRAEVLQMREELDALRAEFAALRTEVQQEAAHLKAAQTVSPLYSDAMQMASAGQGAAVIAERCGISRAEAELVVALVKSQA